MNKKVGIYMSATATAVIKSTRPPFLILAPICVLLGIAIAMQLHREIDADLAIWVFIGAFTAQISVNTFNEYLDYASGLDSMTDKTPFSGGSGSIPALPSAHSLVLMLAVATLLITALIGLYLVSLKGLSLLAIGLVGVVIILAYTRFINRFAWICLLSPGMAFGPLIVVGTYISVIENNLVSGTGIASALLISLVPFFLVNNLLLLNQFPDVEADKKVGRCTYPIQYGFESSIKTYLCFVLCAALIIIGAGLAGVIDWIGLFALLPLVIGLNVYTGVKAVNFNTSKMIPYMGKNVALTLLTTLGLALLIILSVLVRTD
jgi:1,4-dihydroxy-2-naphthoate octaprenyltransferase